MEQVPRYRRLSITTSTSQGRSVPFFFGFCVFLPFICPPLVHRGFARGVASERDHARFETGFVTVGRVHIAQFVVRRYRAAACADGNERAVVALLPRGQPL